jgi:hypothetical protein
MKVVVALPPNIEQLRRVFPALRGHENDTVFTWGETVYAPGGAHILTPALRAHEGVHYSRQTNNAMRIEAWWNNYMSDAEFRLAEELPAHRAEFKQFCADHRDSNQRIRFLHSIGARLASPLYGGLLSAAQARRVILGGKA